MTIPVGDSVERLQGLHRDLLSLTESTLPYVERLWLELEARVEEFRNLLDKPSKNDKSRQALSSGTIKIADQEYNVNEEFRQDAIQIADALDLDELEAAKLYLRAQSDAKELDRTALSTSVILFHTQRQYLLECLRLCFQNAEDDDGDEEITSPFKELIGQLLQSQDGRIGNGSQYWRKCIGSMGDLEKWLQQIADRVQSMSMVGQVQSPEFTEIMEFQRSSLTRQHESLGAITYHLVKATYTNADDLRFLLPRLKAFDKYDSNLMHYLPVTACSISRCASSEGYSSLRDARSLHQALVGSKDTDAWSLRNLQAATTVWWLAEYSGRYVDNPTGSPVQGVDLDAEAEQRSTAFMEALRDGAFQFMLSACKDSKLTDWHDQLRDRFASFLLRDVPSFQSDNLPMQSWFSGILMEQFQSISEAYISNMPDALRKLKIEEDDQRKQMNGRTQLRPAEHEYQLERFLMIMAYAYEGFHTAGEAFWSDPDGNLSGFLRWASQRQATPRIAAFSELLRSVSEGDECASAAHKFLLEEGVSTGRLRRNSPLSWNLILDELQYYATSNRDKSAPSQGPNYQDDRPRPDQLVEPETSMMLECFLRLVGHFCKESSSSREWFLGHQTIHIQEIALVLCQSNVEISLRACAFNVLSSLLTNKTPDIGQGMWTTLDTWVSEHLSSVAPVAKTSSGAGATNIRQVMLDSIAIGFEGSYAFVNLLHALVAPYSEETGLHDSLPFSENLGSAYRMPGIEPYVDFVVGRVFAEKSFDLQDLSQLRICRFGCLNFIATCLSTFNEDLIIFGSKSSVIVDAAIQTSSLSTYARLHPFARVMEWMFNDKVVKALFESIHQDIGTVNDAAGDSPLVLGLMRSIEVVDLILSLQSTYFDIVRPIIKLQSANRGRIVANAALASFEDAILNDLNIVVDLGLYCGSGHQDLVISALRLLQKLTSSRKLVNSTDVRNGRQFEKSRILLAMEKDNESERISRSLIAEMKYDERELEQGPESPGYLIKSNILGFINSCLLTTPDRPTIAHLLLGFRCHSRTLEAAEDSLFGTSSSLLHAVMNFILECPDGDETTVVSWLTAIKNDAMQVLKILWRSPLSSTIVLTEMRLNEFLFFQAIRQPILGPESLWNGRVLLDPEFLIADSAFTFTSFVHQRNAFFEYIASELRLVDQGGMSSLRNRIRSALLGATTFTDGSQFQNPSIFDLVDFSELDVGDSLPLPKSQYFDMLDYSICKDTEGARRTKYNLRSVEQLLTLQQSHVRKSGQQLGPTGEQQLQADAQNILLCLHANNQLMDVQNAHRGALRSWAQLVAVMLDSCDFEPSPKTSFIQQALQMILPKLERSYTEDVGVSLILARLAQSLVRHLDVSTERASHRLIQGDAEADRLFQLFRVALSGICSSNSTSELRLTCYQICSAYIRGISSASEGSTKRKYAIQVTKSFGERFVEVICDDAYSGEGDCRISALLAIITITIISNQENSKYIIDSFVRFNFISVMVDNIKVMATELQETDALGVPLLLAYYNASLSLLLRISQARSGAALVLSAGLFQAIRESRLFNADPDIGLEIDNQDALSNYFELLLAVLRVLSTVVLSRGSQNDQTTSLTRSFLKDCRPTIVSIFKQHAKIGSAGARNEAVMGELVSNLTVLLSSSAFLDSEEETTQHQPSIEYFT